jgi:hypothetical protein
MLSKLLKSLGVDDELRAFVEAYTLDKEQYLYMEWLKRTMEFLASNASAKTSCMRLLSAKRAMHCARPPSDLVLAKNG